MRDSKGRFVKGGASWKGGRNYDAQGYIRVWRPEHPDSNAGYVLEHRLIMEQLLDRHLRKNEIVHHINGVRDDNHPDNLDLQTRKTHPSQDHLKGKIRSKETREKVSKSIKKWWDKRRGYANAS